jgi:GH25 family lysozyme M1 (1,4-beta-N-acetylmuramidase)
MMLRGFDASSVQGKIPYDRLGNEYKFCILKAQQGNDGFDPFFERNAQAALDRGIEPFAYCFTYPLPHLDPKAQAALFVERLSKTVCAGRPIFLDNEWPEVGAGWAKWKCSASQLADWQHANAEEVHRLSGVRPAIYTYDYWWSSVRDRGGDVSWAADYDLWMAWYRTGWPKDGDAPKVPRPFRTASPCQTVSTATSMCSTAMRRRSPRLPEGAKKKTP